MSVRTLHSAASGMEASLFQLDVIANNLANSGTTGFKRSRAEFEDLFYEHFKLPGAQPAPQQTPTGIAVGLGAAIRATQVDFTEGSLNQTGNSLDIAIMGDGFFQIQDPTGGDPYYTRAGTFTKNSEGTIVMSSAQTGRPLEPSINIPPTAVNISITSNGEVWYQEAGSSTMTQAGQIQLARFVNNEGLIQMGENLYRASDASGVATISIPGQDGAGTLRQGFLETSNVEPVRELVELIKTQRNVELNSEAMKAGDQMLQLVNGLRRY
ncbi:MAG: flagellar basal-body rod protein FlgG [Rubinisphaera brasiliensis]|uniref:Flagellar basal-body rod protein FlgG n=1 Tax=Rubinisphaera brasiliensis (strain ATCC 49424 / DSM 5305 / JCM 21570 / IAM 15109 / NBRC 103401 / IFAM 1448) TaxID=756272 RepID=F0SNB6_RUBBR|nr:MULTISPECIES: flagellar basal-body rod protein FlgG [Rubinisphaera]ADY62159.1 flagellar basal-body rod protein FlgG [Rubinisphaera brasiliensis DSM 5305]